MATFYGADISEYQGDIDWPAFNPSASFVTIKASEGIDYKDAKLDRNKAGVRSLGADMPHGFYHFCRGYDAAQEAHWFAQCVGDWQVGEWAAIDWEIDPNIDRDSWNKTFIDTLTQILGFVPGFWYTNQNRLITGVFQQTANTGIGLWIAHYGYTADQDVPIKWFPFYVMHQTSSSGNFPGISGRVDVDAFFAPQLTDVYKYGRPVDAPAPSPIPVTPPQPTPEPTPIVPTPSPVTPPEVTPPPIPPPSTPPVIEHPPVYPWWYVLLSRILDILLHRHVNGKSK